MKKSAVTVLGAALLAAGLAMMVLPGPGILVIVAGLAVLATEYMWARSLLDKARTQAGKAQEAAVASRSRTAGTVVFAFVMIGLGVAMLAIDVDVPFWGGVTGSVLIVTAMILLTTTWLTIRAARGEDSTHTGDHVSRQGSGATRTDLT